MAKQKKGEKKGEKKKPKVVFKILKVNLDAFKQAKEMIMIETILAFLDFS